VVFSNSIRFHTFFLSVFFSSISALLLFPELVCLSIGGSLLTDRQCRMTQKRVMMEEEEEEEEEEEGVGWGTRGPSDPMREGAGSAAVMGGEEAG